MKPECLENRKGSAFTLIELLIVVAIISILSSIAVPNFLEAQTRAKVSRVKADMASMGTALEVYAIDHNNYPYRRNPDWNNENIAPIIAPPLSTKMNDLKVLTTPIPYITRIPNDIFDIHVPPPLNTINYFDPEQTSLLSKRFAEREFYVDEDGNQQYKYKDTGARYWMLLSVGPDGFIGVQDNGQPGGYPPQPPLLYLTITWVYDPTEGTISMGNIYRLQGNADFYQALDITKFGQEEDDEQGED
ncbi:prepilin-type N-terminal cleavage/methylation domain-containing protein [Candidatus Sumerlaeota bacterium]|nr:prepilin-type N-terminal cleavage/methylation domain-containing protein [Candidatus Sumerlaeota bacterium]